jgi:hypothetical protein
MMKVNMKSLYCLVVLSVLLSACESIPTGDALLTAIAQPTKTFVFNLNDLPSPIPATLLPPANQVGDDIQNAEQAILDFLEELNEGNYKDAAELYGGTYEIMVDHNPSLNPNNHAALIQNACTINGAQCLKVKSMVLDHEAAMNEYIFLVEFQNEDGTLFVLGPCCGGNETDTPPRSTFTFSVVKDNEGKFLVMDMPPSMP